MSFLKTNIVNIVVDEQTYNSLDDFGLAIGNTDYIGDPVWDESKLLWVPGRSGPLYMSVFDEQYYLYRPIDIEFGSIEQSEEWDEKISIYRNLFESKDVKLYFLTEDDWYWKGRAHIIEFERQRQLGRFHFTLPYAEPYKYRDNTINVTATTTGVTVNARNSVKHVYPTFTTDKAITVEMDGTTVSMSAGTHKNTAIKFTKSMNEMLIKGNDANVTIDYTEGSL